MGEFYILLLRLLLSIVVLWFKETEVYASVDALLYEAGMLAEIVVLAVFKDEHATISKHTLV